MARIQKAICDQCGKEVLAESSLDCDGLTIRVGNDYAQTYLHDADFCSLECMMEAIKEVSKKIEKKLKETQAAIKAREKVRSNG